MLSFGVDALIGGIILLGVGILVWLSEHRREVTVGIGLGIGLAGVIVLIEVGADTGFSELQLAGAIVAIGVADYVIAPAYGKIQDTGERVSGR